MLNIAQRLIATIDCGSSNVRCIIFDTENGAQVSVASKDWYVPQDPAHPGQYDFDDKTNWNLVCECTKAAVSKVSPRDIIAVTATGFRHGLFALDKKKDEILYGCFNMDSRIDAEYLQEHNLEKKVFEIAGDWPTLHGLPRLMWLKFNNPAAYERITDIMLISDWVIYKLCREIAMEPGNASSTLLLDVKTRQWSSELTEVCEVSASILPRIVDAGTILGKVDSRAGEETGFLEGTPVVCGVADTQAGLVGIGAGALNASSIVGGTYWLSCHSTATPMVDPEYCTRLSCHSEKNQWIYEGIGFCQGLVIRWFRDTFGKEEKDVAQKYGLNVYSLLDGLTENVPAGSYGMQVLMSDIADQKNWRMATPTFMGWDIMNPQKSHKGVFFKALLENACYAANGEFGNIRRVLGKNTIPEKILLSGGAAHSAVWCQILSDVLGTTVSTPQEREGTALGGAIYAAIGMSIYKDTAEAVKAMVKPGRVFEPDAANHDVYLREYTRWRELYKNGLKLLDRGLVKSMWQPDSTLTDIQREDPWHIR